MTGAARHERGLLSTELALLMPVLVVFALAAILAVEVQRHAGRAHSAADAAARAAAVHRTYSAQVDADATRAAERVCQGPVSGLRVRWDAPDPSTLEPGLVRVALTCTEHLGGLGPLLGIDPRSTAARSIATVEYWRAS